MALECPSVGRGTDRERTALLVRFHREIFRFCKRPRHWQDTCPDWMKAQQQVGAGSNSGPNVGVRSATAIHVVRGPGSMSLGGHSRKYERH